MSLFNSLIFVQDNADYKIAEMMIVFVYDTTRCCKEEDDPADAVMYFHPAWVSPTQRLALAGQLMGVNQFLSTSFSTPSMISLQGGKFVLKKFGSYVLAVGTDRNIQDWILERRADILESLLKFFHCDFETISLSLNNDRNKITEKLYQMFETYLPILQYSASLFSNLPMLKLPRSASNVFLEAMQVLQYCQETNGIVGGALFYNNKVIASQLSAEMTKQLVITDPFRIKAPADRIPTNFHLPVGVQLFRVYVEQRQLSTLIQEANMERGYSSYFDNASKKAHKKNLAKPGPKDQPVSMMKRDVSRIFTVPEEAELDATHYNMAHCIPPLYPTAYSSPIKRKEEANNKTERPKYQHPLTPSVCSTPLKDVNRVLHGFAVSICAAGEENEAKPTDSNKQQNEDNKLDSKSKEQNMDDIPDVVKEALRCKRLNKLRNAPPKEKLMLKAKDRNAMSLSLTDLDDSIKKHSSKMVLKTYSIGIPKLNNSMSVDCDDESPKKQKRRRYYNTITDPFYPVFRNDGLPVSQSLYDEYIASHYQELNQTSKISDLKSDFSTSLPPLRSEKLALKINSSTENGSNQTESKPNLALDVRLENKSKQETYRRSMSLPLKPLNALDNDDRRKSTSECGGIFDLPQRRKLDGLQLTPLMSKLSLLADERTSGFCSRETTPSEFRDLPSFSMVSNQLVKNKLEAVSKDGCSDNDDEIDEDWTTTTKDEGIYEKGELFLCGHQNMVLFLLMEDGTANDPDLIHSLWETSISILGCLETRLQQCLEPLPSNESKELYSVLSVDSDWDTIHRSGLWGVTELEVVSSLHDRFRQNKNLTEMIVRTDDTVVYGNQCGNTEVFYQQAVAPNTTGGLPTPADLMGIVPLKAKRRLERDHAIIIL
ncbi:uncharacterized protein LOC100116464 isoform X2 [Nasonia vitripennis]|uniref:CCZ1/INTU/HSP4 first Longin domain-containing protein n=1 Tax=Nasonia vitripennis TaxID=7425 RepID=A0A7M7HAD2_NASVI|nr:uncharacterized protein LOC100116464 isoform X2 [Nasonia vitripennis]